MGINEWFAKIGAMTSEEKLATIRVEEVRFYNDTMVISWSGIIGFGDYTLELHRETEMDEDSGDEVTKSYTIQGDSESLDLGNDNRIFLRHLLNQIADQIDLSEERAREADWKERQKHKGEPKNE